MGNHLKISMILRHRVNFWTLVPFTPSFFQARLASVIELDFAEPRRSPKQRVSRNRGTGRCLQGRSSNGWIKNNAEDMVVSASEPLGEVVANILGPGRKLP